MTFHAPTFIDAVSTDAEEIRQALSSMFGNGGVLAKGGLELTQKGTPNMSVIVNGGTPSEGGIWIPGTFNTNQGSYYCWLDADYELAIPASGSANARVEKIVARVYDNAVDGSGKKEWKVEALKGGEASSGNTLANRGEVAATPASSVVIGYVLVPAKASTIVTADIENVVVSAGVVKSSGRGMNVTWGQVSEAGTIENGSGDFTVTKEGTGVYKITYTSPTKNNYPSVLVTPRGSVAHACSASGGNTESTIYMFTAAGAVANAAFSFMIIDYV